MHVILLGDHDTASQSDTWATTAECHGATVDEVFSFEPGEAAGNDDLTQVRGVVLALGRAIAAGIPIWMPYPREDLWREQHFRRLGITLQRRGLNLLYGHNLEPCPTERGTTEIDYALRAEVRAVDELDRAALAAAGIQILEREIEVALVDSYDAAVHAPPARARRARRRVVEAELAAPPVTGPDSAAVPPPRLPSPKAPWAQRQPALKQFAVWLVQTCGLSQTAAAQCINPTGHRTPQGHLWQQPTVSALIKGRYG